MQEKKNFKRNGILYFIISFVFIIVGSWVGHQGQLSISGEERYKQIQSDFIKKEKTFNKLFQKLTATHIDNTADLVDFYQDNKIDDDFFIFIVYEDSLISAWSSNEIIPAKHWKDNLPQILQIDNKWTYTKQTTHSNTQYTGYLIINNVVGQNEDITITDNLQADSNTILTFKEEKKELYTVHNEAGDDIFVLGIPENLKKSNTITLLEVLLWMIAISTFLFALMNVLLLTNLFSKNTNLLFLVLFLLIALFAIIVSKTSYFSSDLFSPLYYSSHFNSLGTLFFNSYLILLGSIFFMHFVSLKSFIRSTKKTKIIISFIFIFCVLKVHVITYLLITGITNDSVVVLKPEMIYRYDLMSIIALSSIVFILWTAFVLTYKTLNEIYILLQNKKTWLFIIAIEIVISFLLFLILYFCFLRGRNLFIPYSLAVLLIVVTSIFILQRKRSSNLLYYCVIYLILCGIVLFTANQTVDEREKKYKEAMAEMILPIEDPFILDSFSDLADAMEKDADLVKMFKANPLSRSDIQQYIVQKYTQRYAEDYRVNIDIELPLDNMLKNQTLQTFQTLPQIVQKSTDGRVMFQRMGFGRSGYTVKVAVPTNEGKDTAEIILIFRMYVPSDMQSELAKTVQKEMSNYCYAGYEDGILTMNAGSRDITYFFNLSDYKLDTIYSGMEFVSNNVTHTVFKHDNMVLLVSSERSIFWDKISFLVALFLGQILLSILPIILARLYYNTRNLWQPGFQETIQIFVTVLITVTIVIAALLFFRFFRLQRNNDLEEAQSRVSKKTNLAVCFSIGELNNLDDLSSEALARINEELSHFYELDFLDLNIYNKKGENVERYGKGVYINTNINPVAIKALTLNKMSAYIVPERYNGREYKSMYETILNNKGDIIGYTNLLRYQPRHREALDYKQAQFLTKFMSTCIVIILLTVVSSIFLIRYLISPLLKVTDRLSKIQLGEELKEIEWKKDDEIGSLVNTYNVLIDRLKISAELLEKSSQEIAWKDMAKQVAHEIKNPLTPMRLTTQHLLRELDTKKSLKKEKLEQYFSMIIHQTDTLTDIASSFSNFAKINQQEGQPEDLLPIIQNTASSYSENPFLLFHLWNRTGQEQVMSFVNKSQISQVFNNLIKNAIQAKKQEQVQTVTIEIENYGDKMWQIKVSDTGIGMPDKIKGKIFSPNFTTKTSGMGLGLAMVQRIILNWGGNITFESTHNVGTTFFITLPKYVGTTEHQ